MSLWTKLKKINRWDFLGAFGLESPSNTFRWTVYSIVCLTILSEWVVVGFVLLDKNVPSERTMTTITNSSFVPMAFYCLYHVIVSGKRVDLIVDAIFALGTANASLWYHMCSGSKPPMEYCTSEDGSKDPDVFNMVMWWDFAASYMMFIQAAWIIADLREVVLKIPIYATSMILCYEGMRERSERTKSLGSEHIKWALGFACTAVVLRCAYVFGCFLHLQRNSPLRAARDFLSCVNPLAFCLGGICFAGGMLCNFVWTDQSAPSLDSGYTTPHGFWHIGMGSASGFVAWLAVKFSENWQTKVRDLRARLHPKSPASKPPVEEDCEMVEIEPFDINV